jgi:uncharacterized damage-inducible protein DinB
MIDQTYLVTMAEYNRWQNENLYGCADKLDDAARRLDRGAFFGSIHATLKHLLWADQLWLSRFSESAGPRAKGNAAALAEHETWEDLKRERVAFDQKIIDWAAAFAPGPVTGELTWFSGGMGRQVSRPKALLMAHMFNHQTHHRGQVHALLTAAGIKPSDTDLAFMP